MSDFKFRYLKEIPASMPDPAHRILVAIWNHSNEAGLEAFPGVDTLAAETGKSRATVLRWMKWLRDSGWIVQEYRGGRSGDGRTWSSVYSLGHGTIPGEVQPANLDEPKTVPNASHARPGTNTQAVVVRPAEERPAANAVPSVSGSDWTPTERCWDCNKPIPYGALCAACEGKRICESGRHAPQPVESVSF